MWSVDRKVMKSGLDGAGAWFGRADGWERMQHHLVAATKSPKSVASNWKERCVQSVGICFSKMQEKSVET